MGQVLTQMAHGSMLQNSMPQTSMLQNSMPQNSNPMTNTASIGIPLAMVNALRAQRNYTLSLYADLPELLWLPADVPYLSYINPPLWELGHIAWFQEYFALRLPAALSVAEKRALPPSLSWFAEALLNSNIASRAG